MRKVFFWVVLVSHLAGGWWYLNRPEAVKEAPVNFSALSPELQRVYQMARMGNPQMQLSLGYMFAEGKGLPKDMQQAISWYKKSAEQGFTLAESLLGSLYLKGEGIEQNHAEAERWLRKAADKGHPQSQGMLGGMLYFGHGVQKDYVQAYMWLSLASEAQNRSAKIAMNQLANRLDESEIQQALVMASRWRESKSIVQ